MEWFVLRLDLIAFFKIKKEIFEMKRIISLILVVCMLCTLGLALTSCGTSIESVKEKCDKLKEDNEIAGYFDASGIAGQFDGVTGAIYISSNNMKSVMYVIEFEDKDNAKECEEELKKDAGEDDIVKRKGTVVIATEDKDLYDLVF